MPVIVDFSIARYEDAIINMSIVPPTPIGGWSIQFDMMHRFGGEGFTVKSMASGMYGVSGMNIVNSGQGVMQIRMNAVNTSGRDYGEYAFAITRTDSGFRTVLTEGYAAIMPSVG